MTERDDTQEINLRQYLAVIRQKYWLVLIALAVVFVPALIVLLREEPVYEASSTILIEQGQAIIDETGYSKQSVDPEVEEALLKSRPVMSSVLRTSDPYFDSISENERIARIASLRSQIRISFNKSATLVSIAAESISAPEAAKIANAVSRTYIEETRRRELNEANTWIDWFGEQLSDMREKVKNAEKKFQDFKLENGIIGLDERKQELALKVNTSSGNHLQVRLERINAEIALQALEEALKKGPVAAVPTFASYGSTEVTSLKSQIDELKAELGEKEGIFKPKHPVIVELKEKIRLLNSQLASLEQDIVNTQRTKVQSLMASEESLEKTLSEYKEDVQKLNALELQYSILEREVTSSRELYDLLVERRKKSAVESGVSRRRMSVVEPAVVPAKPVAQKMALKLVVASIIGLMIGVGLAFLIDYLEMTYKTPEDIEKHLGLWVIGMIPRFEPGTEAILGFADISSGHRKQRRDK
ncbi:MAG: GumC family protein [Candidatus Coatesbacteria bacterium]|nr:GumC family protein [Candidatus Coatesbacteria bacterium]